MGVHDARGLAADDARAGGQEASNKQYKVRDPNHPSRVVAGFIKSGGLFAYPQVVLQVLEADMSQLSWPALQRMCKDGGEDESPGAETAALIAGLMDSSGADPDLGIQFNQGAGQVSCKGDLVLDDQSTVKTACRTFLHSGGAIQLTGLDYLTSSGGEQRAYWMHLRARSMFRQGTTL